MITVAVYDTRPYDREYLERAGAGKNIEWRFWDFRVNAQTAATAKGAQAVCVFVNDELDRPCLEALAAQGVRLIALRSTGFNSLDIPRAIAT